MSRQLLFSIFLGGVTIAAFYHRIRMEEKLRYESIKRGQKSCLIEPLMLPVIFAMLFFMLLVIQGGLKMSTTLVDWGLLFLNISAYYALLLLLLPLLRRIISAQACATLWLVPGLLYFTVYALGFERDPRFVLTVPRQRLSVFLGIWAAGFAAVAAWQVISHFRHRRLLLKSAEGFADHAALSRWHSEAKRHGIKAEIPVLVSGAVSTPVTIGCFDRTMRLILPEQQYTEAELALIFRHELRHILRADTRTKMFIGFCAAICWFNPLGWIARKKASDDLELSCDEAVLADADQGQRRQYAELLLKNAGSSRGYTTCLSASASSLRYRLRSIMKPGKRLSGGVVVGLALFGLFMTVGAVALADSPGTVRELVFDKAPPETRVWYISISGFDGEAAEHRRVYAWSEARLTEYLASLRVKEVYSGHYTADSIDGPCLSIAYEEVTEGETASLTWLRLTDGLLAANIPYDELGYIMFLPQEEIDWAYLLSLLDLEAEDPDPPPVPPEMLMYFDGDVSVDGPMHAAHSILSMVQAGQTVEDVRHLNDSSVGGVEGCPVTRVRLEFTYPPQGDFTIRVENWDRSASYTVSGSTLTGNVLPLAGYSAHYTVSGMFASYRDTVYEMSFYFDVGLPE